jgi:hypothetical protein
VLVDRREEDLRLSIGRTEVALDGDWGCRSSRTSVLGMVAEVLAIPRRPRVDFDDMAVGPELAAALDEVDMAALVGEDIAAGAQAATRAANHADWQRLSWLHEMCRARAGSTEREPEPDAAVAAITFGWSMAMATAQLALAAGALERLPDLGEALHEGWLEARKAAVFVTVLADLDDTQATNVVATVLPEAPRLPVHQLTQRVTAAAEAVDPTFAERRHAAARGRARLRTSLSPAGTANLSVCDADPETAQDAYLHVQTLARLIRARLRVTGRRVRLGYIASHVLLRLSSGTLAGADDEAVIDAIVQELSEDPYASGTDPEAGPDPDAGPDGPAGTPDGGPDDRPAGGPGGGPAPDPGSAGSDGGPCGSEDGPDGPDGGPDDGPDRGPDDGPGGGPHDDAGGGADGGPEGPDHGPDDGPDEGADDCAGGGSDGGHEGGPDDGPSIGLDGESHGRPDSDAGGGPDEAGGIPADARGRSDRSDSGRAPGSSEDGPDDHDSPGSVPPGSGRADSSSRSEPDRVPLLPGVVLRLPLSTLLGLDDRPGELPGWGPVSGHRAAEIASRRPGARCQLLLHDRLGTLEYLLDLGPPPAATTNRRRRQVVEITAETELLDALDPDTQHPARQDLLRRARAALEALRAHPEKHPAVSTADRDRRFPGPALAAWVRARDQHCPFRACTRPARDNDLDHTVAREDHGPTEAANLSPPCRAHHTRKHRAWRLRQPRPGRFVVTDPTGTEHHTTSRVVDPLPDPCPPVEEEPERLPAEAFLPLPDEPADPWRPRRTRDGHLTAEARDAADHLADRARHLRGDPPTRYDADPDF